MWEMETTSDFIIVGFARRLWTSLLYCFLLLFISIQMINEIAIIQPNMKLYQKEFKVRDWLKKDEHFCQFKVQVHDLSRAVIQSIQYYSPVAQWV